MSGKLTKAQREVLATLPDTIALGIPATTVSALCGHRASYWARDKLVALRERGLVLRDKPSGEWPFVYALTDAGRRALKDSAHDR